MSHSTERTSLSLLARLRSDADPEAWSLFVRRYAPMLYRWARAWGLQEADAEDITQSVLLKIARRIKTFQYDPTQSFRAYLKTLAHYAWCDLRVEEHQRAAGGDSRLGSALESLEARDDLARRLAEEFDQELLEQAQQRVRERIEPHTWEAFHLTAVEGVNGAEAAQRLGLTVATVFKARSRVQQMLREEVAGQGER